MEVGFCWRARLALALCSLSRGREMPFWRMRSRVAEPPIFSRALPRNFLSRSVEVLERREELAFFGAAGPDFGQSGHGVTADFFGGIGEEGEEPLADGAL